MWADETTTSKEVEWVIERMPVAIPYLETTTFVYSGSSNTPTQVNYVNTYMTRSGTSSATAVPENDGKYMITYSLRNNYIWEDGTEENKIVEWTVTPKPVPVPSTTSSFTYNGSTRTPTWTNYSSSYITKAGDLSGVNAGTYTAKFTISSTNYMWEDGTREEKSVKWTINKAPRTMILSSTNVTINNDNPTVTITYSFNPSNAASGMYQVPVSSDSKLATAKYKGDGIEISQGSGSLPLKGTATITFKITDGITGSNYLETSATCTVNVDVKRMVTKVANWTSLSSGRASYAATSVADTRIFIAGGTTTGVSTGVLSTIETYNAEGVKGTTASLTDGSGNAQQRLFLAATNIDKYAIIGGGASSYSGIDNAYNTVYIYDSSGTKLNNSTLSDKVKLASGGKVGNYAVIAGGADYNGNREQQVTAFSSSLTKPTINSLTYAAAAMEATTVGNHLIFGGDYNVQVAQGYTNALVRETPISLNSSNSFMGAATAGDYAIFVGSGSTTTVIDKNYTKQTSVTLSQSRYGIAGVTLKDYAIFAGGGTQVNGGGSSYSTVDAFDSNLQRSTPTALSQSRGFIKGAAIDKYAVFPGGSPAGYLATYGVSNVVDVYTVN